MATKPAVDAEVQVRDGASEYNRLYGVVRSVVAATSQNAELYRVALRPAGLRTGDAGNTNVKTFRASQLHVISGGATWDPAAPEPGNAALDKRLNPLQAAWLGSFFETCDVIPLFAPADIDSDADGDWIDITGYAGALVVFFKSAGTAGDDPSLRTQQATSTAGGGSKDLKFSAFYHKIGASLASVGVWTKVTVNPPVADRDLATPVDYTSDNKQGMFAIEFLPTDLDRVNGYKYVQFSIEGDDIGNPQLGCAFVVLYGRTRSAFPPPSQID